VAASKYNDIELMVIVASRILEDNSLVVVGTGGPCAATMLAQKLHAPGLIPIFEAGGVGPILEKLPISVGQSRTYHRGLHAGSMSHTMNACARGLIDYCFLGGAQIDMYGNLNSTIIGKDYEHPKARLPGSGGANDLASMCWRIIVMTLQDKRRFVEKVDFLTTPGYLTGKSSREKAGLYPGTGPYKVVTNLGVMGYDTATCRMKVESLHPGVTIEKVMENTGFELLVNDELTITPAPTEMELDVLRHQVDPDKMFIGRE
jgi:glutaconate CoA-transferase, subunit B